MAVSGHVGFEGFFSQVPPDALTLNPKQQIGIGEIKVVILARRAYMVVRLRRFDLAEQLESEGLEPATDLGISVIAADDKSSEGCGTGPSLELRPCCFCSEPIQAYEPSTEGIVHRSAEP